MIKIQNNDGFVATLLIISISAMILAFSFMSSIEIGHFFDEVMKKEYRLMSYYDGYACLDQAMLAISHDYFVNLNKQIDFPDLSCSIDSILDNNGEKIITAHGNYKNIVIFRIAIVKVYDDHLEIISIK